jgi:hypothetical protein
VGGSDYGPKSICGKEWNPFEIGQGREKRSWSINRNHQSLGYSVLIRGGSACLFLGQMGIKGATFLSVLVIVQNRAPIHPFIP